MKRDFPKKVWELILKSLSLLYLLVAVWMERKTSRKLYLLPGEVCVLWMDVVVDRLITWTEAKRSRYHKMDDR